MAESEDGKSRRSDQLRWSGLDFPQASATAVVSEAPKVHKSVHRRELRMVKLQQDSNGNYRARKRLPEDVREEYSRLYGARHEAKFFAPKNTKSHEAKRLFGEWLAEVEGRIAAKGNVARFVPLHQHLVAQGFLKFVAQHRDGPLFYNPDRSALENDPIKRKKPRYAQVRQRLADWVRESGVNDPNISPNHAWRHTFKRIGRRARISDVVLDDICGHAPASDGAAYGASSLEDMAEALRRFPRYKLKGS
jgi:integrase